MNHLILSPHLDDAALSLGAAIHRWTRLGDSVFVVTICAGNPALPRYSRFAHELHRRWGVTAEEAVGARRREDRRALTSLGAQPLYLNELDAIYRLGPGGRWLYPSGEAIFGPLHQHEVGGGQVLTRQLRALAKRRQIDRVYAPLTIGDHVDHVRVRAAAESSGLELQYYEDFPYAIRENRTPDWRGRAAGLTPRRMRCTAQDLEAKRQAILTYVSQISSLWPSSAAFEADFEAFHRSEKGPGEWIWSRRVHD